MVTAQLSPLGISALALLAERPMHPYEMYLLLLQRREDRVVKIRPGSLYHAVDRLAHGGLVRAVGTQREGNRPERTTYEITASGREALATRVAEMIGTPTNEYPQFPLAISEAHNLELPHVIGLLEARSVALHAELHSLDEAIAQMAERGLARRFWLDADYARTVLVAEIDWIDCTRRQMAGGDLPWEGKEANQPEPDPLKA